MQDFLIKTEKERTMLHCVPFHQTAVEMETIIVVCTGVGNESRQLRTLAPEAHCHQDFSSTVSPDLFTEEQCVSCQEYSAEL